MSTRRKIVTEVPVGINYGLEQIKKQTSFGATLAEAASQVGTLLNVRISYDNIADIIASEFPPEITPLGRTICNWVCFGKKPNFVDDAKAVARAFRLPEILFTRFYESCPPPYEKS